MADDRRSTLEHAVELLSAARDLTAIAKDMRGEKAAKLRGWADTFTDRGLRMVLDDLARTPKG
jgi:hypothetical protein